MQLKQALETLVQYNDNILIYISRSDNLHSLLVGNFN